MSRKEHEVAHQGAAAAIPLPKKEEKRVVQAEINMDLWTAVEHEMKREGVTIRQVIEYGLKAYLTAANPKAAAELGITNNK